MRKLFKFLGVWCVGIVILSWWFVIDKTKMYPNFYGVFPNETPNMFYTTPIGTTITSTLEISNVEPFTLMAQDVIIVILVVLACSFLLGAGYISTHLD